MKQRNLLQLVLLFVAVANVAQAQDAGTVSFATGEVSAERQPPVPLVKGDAVLGDDTIATGDASRAQLMMIDGARIAIRPNSRLQIEEYVHAAATPGTTISSSDDKSVMSLVKGGFRSITGAIGKDNPQNYEVRTPVGVLGIRGTDFAMLLCIGDCDWAPGVAAGTPVPDGLYIMVTDGTIVFRNEVMNIDVTAGEFVFIPLDTRRPMRLDTTPPVFIDDTAFAFDPRRVTVKPQVGGDDPRPDDDAAPSGFDSALGTRRAPDSSAPPPGSEQPGEDDGGDTRDAPAQSIQGTDEAGNQFELTPGNLPDPRNRSNSWSGGPLGQADAIFSGVADNAEGEFAVDANDDLTGFNNLYPGSRTGPPQPASFDIGTATTVESGADALTFMRWGRWSGGTATIVLSDGTDVSQDLGNQSLHWIVSPEWATPPAMPVSGVANYTLIGSTSPTDGQGNVGVLGDATFQADFTNMLVTSTLLININGFTWNADGNGVIGAQAGLPAHLFQGLYGTVTITDAVGNQFTGDGQFSGFFSEPGPTSDPGYPGGAGLTYSLQDQGSNTQVSGAAAFGDP